MLESTQRQPAALYNTQALIDFRNQIRDTSKSIDCPPSTVPPPNNTDEGPVPSLFHRPTLVHCSAGVGRTGTYIGLDIAMNKMEKELIYPNIKKIVTDMRKYRMILVQTEVQYVFLNKCIMEIVKNMISE